MTAYRLTIPLRDSDGGDLVLTVDPEQDAYLMFPLDRLDHLADLEWVVVHVERVEVPADDRAEVRDTTKGDADA